MYEGWVSPTNQHHILFVITLKWLFYCRRWKRRRQNSHGWGEAVANSSVISDSLLETRVEVYPSKECQPFDKSMIWASGSEHNVRHVIVLFNIYIL